MPTPTTRRNQQIHRTSDGHPVIVLASQATLRVGLAGAHARRIVANAVKTATDKATRFLALGYQQTDMPAAKGGRANANGFRFRRGALRSIARSFRGNAFITGHNWGDVRARGGTIMDAYAEEMETEGGGALTDGASTGIYYEIEATADWAVAGLKNGTIDRFSLGVMPKGEIMCTVHGVPVWSTAECFCFPGELVADPEDDDPDPDDGPRMVVAEWEYQDGDGVEISAVNVPAVDGTHIVETYEPEGDDDGTGMEADPHDDEAEPDEDAAETVRAVAAGRRGRGGFSERELAALCGRRRPTPPDRPLVVDEARFLAGAGGGARVGAVAATATAPTLTRMTHEELCQLYGLPVTATPAELRAKISEVTAAAAQAPALQAQLRSAARDAEVARERETAAAREREAQLAAEVLTQHVDLALDRSRRTHVLSATAVTRLRETAATRGRDAFDRDLEFALSIAPQAAPPVGGQRPTLLSDATPRTTEQEAAIAAAAGATVNADGPDPIERLHDADWGHVHNHPSFVKALGEYNGHVAQHGGVRLGNARDAVRAFGTKLDIQKRVVPKLADVVRETNLREAREAQ